MEKYNLPNDSRHFFKMSRYITTEIFNSLKIYVHLAIHIDTKNLSADKYQQVLFNTQETYAADLYKIVQRITKGKYFPI